MNKHGMTGQQNALKDDSAATSHLHIRVTPDNKASWVSAAGGEKLSEWVTRTLNEQAKGNETSVQPILFPQSWLDNANTHRAAQPSLTLIAPLWVFSFVQPVTCFLSGVLTGAVSGVNDNYRRKDKR